MVLLLGVPSAQAADLLVSSADTDQVLRYDGTTGAFLGDFVPPGSGGLSLAGYLTFTPAVAVVPEPSTFVLLASGILIGGLVKIVQVRRTP